MAYDTKIADRIREFLTGFPDLKIEEKRMFRGMTFMINGRMTINVSGRNLMCRFDPSLTDKLSQRKGYLPVIMKGRAMKGYCYVEPDGFSKKRDFEFWVKLCLDFNLGASTK